MTTKKPSDASRGWWIATDLRRLGGKRLLGPFVTRDLALDVRAYVEKVNRPTKYAVDEWPGDAETR